MTKSFESGAAAMASMRGTHESKDHPSQDKQRHILSHHVIMVLKINPVGSIVVVAQSALCALAIR